MASKIESLTHAAQRQALKVAIDSAYNQIEKPETRTEAFIKITDLAGKFLGDSAKPETLDAVKTALRDPDNRWVRFLNKIIDETNPKYAKKMLLNLGYEAFFRGTKLIRENRKKYHCNIPWLILFDPTMACNMKCVGCWSGTYGHKANLSFEDMDKIVTQGKELGAYLYMMTG
ncbi:MAG TPA: pyrroloquinoline quinone biosynthesis protein PqqE, partial [Lachnospiraceae bacterium]|nr:pyrroloquinoline quinone biosynthesis protein PqqE [Lachnospiraceae bacterium]